jgi:chemotaxis protein MotB
MQRLLLLLLAAMLPLQGCLVTKKKYTQLQEDRDRLAELLEQRESDLTAAQDSFRTRLETAQQELEAYKQQAGDAEESAAEARQEPDQAHKLAAQIQREVKNLGIGQVRDGRLVLQDSLVFQSGSAKLSTSGKRALDKVARAFRGKDVLVQIDGHTDSTPIAKPSTKKLHGDNMGLSAHRALAVFRYLASRGISERNMYIRGFGAGWPVASNATRVSKAKNRRVEILFIPASLAPRPKAG